MNTKKSLKKEKNKINILPKTEFLSGLSGEFVRTNSYSYTFGRTGFRRNFRSIRSDTIGQYRNSAGIHRTDRMAKPNKEPNKNLKLAICDKQITVLKSIF